VKSRYPIQMVNYFLPNGTFSPNFGQYPETSDPTPPHTFRPCFPKTQFAVQATVWL